MEDQRLHSGPDGRSGRIIVELTQALLVKSEPHHSFGKDLIGETWELEL